MALRLQRKASAASLSSFMSLVSLTSNRAHNSLCTVNVQVQNTATANLLSQNASQLVIVCRSVNLSEALDTVPARITGNLIVTCYPVPKRA